MTNERGRDSASEQDDIAALAKGGRANIFGFLLRLAARMPFLFIGSRVYGAAVLGRYAYAVLAVEFAAQLATMGLKRGLAERLAHEERPPAHVVADALFICLLGCSAVVAFLMIVPEVMFPSSAINGSDRLFPLVIFAIALADVALAACAFRYDIAATVRARSIVEPWAISIAAGAFYFYSHRDGLIMAYATAMVAALVASLWPMLRHYGLPRGWTPQPARLWRMVRRNLPLAAADAIEWGTRRLDFAILGLFAAPEVAGIYYVAQQVASLPQKLKTSFEPILGPVISRNVAIGNLGAIARQVSQVGFWIAASQLGIALALGIPGEALMGLFGAKGAFVGGTGVLAALLAAEVLAAPAVVSEAALVYLARHKNILISLATIGLQGGLTVAAILAGIRMGLPPLYVAALPATVLALVLTLGALAKCLLLGSITASRIRIWRASLVIAGLTGTAVGIGFTLLPHSLEWVELLFGIPAILASYGIVIWMIGFGPEDRALFRQRKLGKAALGDEVKSGSA
ncbi:MAG: oligosaccharide flippase family protein [Sphingobium sp.]|nr:oligosaccharide flippase family protein [Sphingobium sp.]